MAGLVFHRLSDNWQINTEDNTAKVANTSSPFMQDNKEDSGSKSRKDPKKGTHSRPPVAYASVAPFPFLPAPSYGSY